MKPSERIFEIANENRPFDDIVLSWHDYIKAILQYMDEKDRDSNDKS